MAPGEGVSLEPLAWGAKGGGRWRQLGVGSPGWPLLPESGSERAAAQPRPPRLLPPPGVRELGSDSEARGEEGKGGLRPWTRGGQGGESVASPEPAAGCHLQPLKEAPPEKMPSVASCRCSLEPKRHLADWGGSGAYVFIGLTLPCPRRKAWLQRAGAGRAQSMPRSLRASVLTLMLSRSPHSHPFVDNFLLDAQLSWLRPLSPSRGQKVLAGGGNRQTSDDFLSAKSRLLETQFRGLTKRKSARSYTRKKEAISYPQLSSRLGHGGSGAAQPICSTCVNSDASNLRPPSLKYK